MIIEGKTWTRQEIASRIDHTVLAPDAVRSDVEQACTQARAYGFKAVFTNPYWTPLAAELLEGSGVAAGISAAFPLGSLSSAAKALEVEETLRRVKDRLCAVDMMTNEALLKEKRYAQYTEDIREVVKAASGRPGMVVKAIVETSLLEPEEIRAACACAAEAGVDFVKTSTGRGGAPNLFHIRIMKESLPPEVGVKFSGFGVHDCAELAFLAFVMGADLIGTPRGPFIVDALCDRYALLSGVFPRPAER